MIVTKAHLAFWRAKHVPVWASKIEVRKLSRAFAAYETPTIDPGPSVHELINSQDRSGYPHNPKAKRPSTDLHNTLALLRLVRSNIETRAEKRTLIAYLEDLRFTGDKGRAKWALRFLAKINHAKGIR